MEPEPVENYSYYICRTPSPVNISEDKNENENEKKNKQDFSKIIQLIRNKIKNNSKEYHFRPFKIDGVYCYIVLYLKEKMLTIESINVKCKFTKTQTLPYVLYHKKYKSVEKVVNLIYNITTKYKIINGDLLSPENYNDIKTEENIIPYNEDEVCCVCLDNTTDNTTCGHFICFKCRDKCIVQMKKNCPMCRCDNVLPTYCNIMNLINNIDYYELHLLFSERFHKLRERDDDNNSVISSSSEEEEEEEEEDSDSVSSTSSQQQQIIIDNSVEE